MASPSPGCAITVRVEASASPDATSGLVVAAREAEGVLTAPDVVESHGDRCVVDVICDAIDGDHARRIEEVLVGAPGMCVREVQDQAFLVHFGGKLRTASKVPMEHRQGLSRAYTPGVSRICRAIAEKPAEVRSLTLKGNTIAVVTGGAAVLGRGNIGPAAALPVVEGTAVLFERSAGVDARPVCREAQAPSGSSTPLRRWCPPTAASTWRTSPLRGASKSSDYRARSSTSLVLHDDQHGTASAVLAVLTHALRVVGKRIDEVLVVSGAGAAGHAIVALLLNLLCNEIKAGDRPGPPVFAAAEDELDGFGEGLGDELRARGGELSGVLCRFALSGVNLAVVSVARCRLPRVGSLR